MFANLNLLTRIAAVLAVLMGTSVMSGCSHRHSPEDAQKFITWKVNDVLDDLDATKAQREEILDVKDQLFAHGLTFRDSSKKYRDALLAELLSDNPDRQKMHDDVDAWIEELRAFAHEAVDGAVDVHQTLDAEQRKQLIDEYGDRLPAD